MLLRLSLASHGGGDTLHRPLLATGGHVGLEVSWAPADGATPDRKESISVKLTIFLRGQYPD